MSDVDQLLLRALAIAWLGIAALLVVLLANRPIRYTGRAAAIIAAQLVALAGVTAWLL